VRRPRRPKSSRLFARNGLRGEVTGEAALGFGRATLGSGFSPRCRCGLVTRGVRADRVGAKLRRRLSSGRREESGGESRPAPGPRNLGWHRAEPLRAGRKACSDEETTVSPGVDGRLGGRGPNPFRRSSPSPAQAGCVTSDERAGNRAVPWLCLRAVLVAGFDERRPVQVFHSQRVASSRKNPPGPGHLASCSGGERTLEAGTAVETSRPGARFPVIPCLTAGQGAS